MKKIFTVLSFNIILLAKGTLAGTEIQNSAKISYSTNSVKQQTVISNIDTFIVDRVVDIKLNWQNLKPVEVSAKDKSRVLTFNLANLGNSEDNITLSNYHNNMSDFKAENIKIYIDANNNKKFDNDDKESKYISLKSDESKNIFLVADIPDNNNTIPNAKDIENLIATTGFSKSDSKDIKNAVDTVYRKPKSETDGIWIVRNYWLSSKKSAIILNSDNLLHTGDIIEYKIDTFIDGDSKDRTIKDIVITDKLIDKVEYIRDSLVLDGVRLTDSIDADEGEYNSGNITVNVGTIMGSTHRILTFKVKVK